MILIIIILKFSLGQGTSDNCIIFDMCKQKKKSSATHFEETNFFYVNEKVKVVVLCLFFFLFLGIFRFLRHIIQVYF